jgi:hypothetical protein
MKFHRANNYFYFRLIFKKIKRKMMKGREKLKYKLEYLPWNKKVQKKTPAPGRSGAGGF